MGKKIDKRSYKERKEADGVLGFTYRSLRIEQVLVDEVHQAGFSLPQIFKLGVEEMRSRKKKGKSVIDN